jgi:hypothetical protein
MIWALADLVRSQKRFTTLELQNKIMTEAPSFPRKQSVLVMERDDPCDQRLVLAPLPSPTQGISTTSAHTLDELPQHHVDLRFWYLNRPDGLEVENLANRLKRLMKDKNIDARCVSWLGLKSHQVAHLNGDARPANSIWMSLNSASNASRASSSNCQAEMVNGNYQERFGLVRRGGQGMIWQIIRGLNPRLLPISVFLSLGLYAWYGFPYSSFPFKIW